MGFAAESEDVIAYATVKRHSKQLDLIVANDISNDNVFNQDTTSVSFIDSSDKVRSFDDITKNELALLLCDYLERFFIDLASTNTEETINNNVS